MNGVYSVKIFSSFLKLDKCMTKNDTSRIWIPIIFLGMHTPVQVSITGDWLPGLDPRQACGMQVPVWIFGQGCKPGSSNAKRPASLAPPSSDYRDLGFSFSTKSSVSIYKSILYQANGSWSLPKSSLSSIFFFLNIYDQHVHIAMMVKKQGRLFAELSYSRSQQELAKV